MLDDLARPRRAVVAHRRDARGHRLLEHERIALGLRAQRHDRGLGPLTGDVAGRPGELDPAVESGLAAQRLQLPALGTVSEDPQSPVGDERGDPAERADQLAELLLAHQPTGRDDDGVVEPRARDVALRERVGQHDQARRGGAELAGEPGGGALGEQGHHVGARAEGEQRLQPRDAVGGGPVLLVHQHDAIVDQLLGDGQQAWGDRDQHLGREVGQPRLEGEVAGRGELGIPAGGHEQRRSRVQVGVVEVALAYVDEELGAHPRVDVVVRPGRAAGDADHLHVVPARGQRVGLADRRARRTARPGEVEDQECQSHGDGLIRMGLIRCRRRRREAG